MKIVIVGRPIKNSSGVKTHVDSLSHGLEKNGVCSENYASEFSGMFKILVAILVRLTKIINKDLSTIIKIKLIRFYFEKVNKICLEEGTVLSIQSVVWYEIFKKTIEKNNVPVVLTVHGPYSDELRIKGHSEYFIKKSARMEKDIYKKASKIVTVSEPMSTYIKNFAGIKDIKVIPNGIKISEESSVVKHFSHEQEVKCVFVGRLEKHKGANIAIESVRKSYESGVNVRLDIFGDGSELKNLEKLIINLNAENYIKLRGVISNDLLRNELPNYDISLIPSLPFGKGGEEPFNYVCIESMNAGLLTIASKIGGLGKIITSEINGFLVEPGDIKEISDLINSYSTDKKSFYNIRNKGQLLVSEKYSSQVMAKKYLELYNNVK